MDAQMRQRLIGVVVAALAITANVVGIARGLPWFITVITALLLIIVYLVYLLLEARRATKPKPSVAEKMRIAIAQSLPGNGFISDFFSSTFFSSSASLRELRIMNPQIHLSLIRRDYVISATDFRKYEEYCGENLGVNVLSGFGMMTYGGSSLKLNQLEYCAYQIEGSTRSSLSLYAQIDEERFKTFFVRFNHPLTTGGSFHVEYEELWPRAMTWGTDIVTYPHPLLYPKGIRQLKSLVTFDRPVSDIGAYWFDVDSGGCEPDDSQPIHCNGGHVYEWTVMNPVSTRLYFIIFTRT